MWLKKVASVLGPLNLKFLDSYPITMYTERYEEDEIVVSNFVTFPNGNFLYYNFN